MASNRIPYFLIGLGVGAAFGLLVAPRSGAETRDGIRRSAEEGRDLVARGTGKIRKVATEVVEKSRDLVEEQRADLESALAAGVRAYRQASGEHW